ncbi:hypothetical protein LINPERHAP1_LOCUS26563 [Linum perenne]
MVVKNYFLVFASIKKTESSNNDQLKKVVGDSDHQHGIETLRFQEFKSRNWEVVIEHTYREGHCAADFLASLGYNYPFGSRMIHISDCRLGYFLRYDSLWISIPRSILINDYTLDVAFYQKKVVGVEI